MARRSPAYLAAVLCLAAISLLVTASPASAHAVLVSSSPADGAILAHLPARVSATFDEPVGVSADSLRVFAPNGARVDTGATVHASKPQEITVALRPDTARGTYTVGWHVISADSHPVQSAFTFSVGAPSSTAVTPASLRPPASRLVGIAFGVVRWLAFCCFALLAGVIAFVIWCWPAGAGRPAVLRLAMGAWAGLAASVLATVLLQGIYGAGQGIGHVFWPDVLHATLYSRYGRALGVRLLLVVAVLFVFTIVLGGLPGKGRRERATAGAVWGVLTAALAATWAAADHAGTGFQVALAVPADIVHLSAMAIWLGGLAVLVTIVLRRPGRFSPTTAGRAAKRRDQEASAEAAQAVVRFSPLALGCVAAILVTGTYMAWRGVGTLGALTGTTYGRLLLVKIAGLCMLIALGYLARRRIAEGLQAPGGVPDTADTAATDTAAASLVGVKAGVAAPAGHSKAGGSARARHGGTGADVRHGSGWARATTAPGGSITGNGARADVERVNVTLRRLRWSVAAETVIAVVVLAVTAVLVNTPTAREAYLPPASASITFDTGAPGGQGSLSLTVTPARLGPNGLRISLTSKDGKPYRPQGIQAAVSLPARRLGPLPVPLTPEGPGRYRGGPVVISTSGQWELQVTIRSDAFDEANVFVPFPVR